MGVFMRVGWAASSRRRELVVAALLWASIAYWCLSAAYTLLAATWRSL